MAHPPRLAAADPASGGRLPLAIQLGRFVIVGALSAVVDFGLLLVGQYALGLDHSLAKAVSWVFGTITAYAINRRWTFRSDGGRRRFAAVVTLYLLTFAFQVGTFSVLFPPLRTALGDAGASTVGFVIAQGLATTVNFVVQRTVIFRA
nr:GtrA family protein [Propionibacterium sp.]